MMAQERLNDMDTSPWYRQFWPWFLLILPGTVVIASISTLVIAVRYSDNLVDDNYYRDGLAINRYLAQDDLATAMNLGAQIRITAPDTIAVSLLGLQNAPDHLLLHWQHPTYEANDFTTVLTNQGQAQYMAQLKDLPSGRWYVTLEDRPIKSESVDTPGSWRLKSEVTLTASSAGYKTINLSAAQ
tara:strand:- start:9999 stop:10553 length:555 start_codon:yes stop_codon:yes gene_type:complete